MTNYDSIQGDLTVTAPEGTAYIVKLFNGELERLLPEEDLTVKIGNPEAGDYIFTYLDVSGEQIGEPDTITI